eukprot:PLAT4629.3.p1 GENE.PLAT4629.3~~PLAT4629.3.p1  ORF type:complete len:298 (-),score=141.84 PLAT4629.3:95-949(-)
MEALKRLSKELWWSEDAPPAGLLLLRDELAAPGDFLLQHVAALFLLGGQRLAIVSFANTLDHYAAVQRKLGVNWRLAEEEGRITFVDGLAEGWCAPAATEGSAEAEGKAEEGKADEHGSAVRLSQPDGCRQLLSFVGKQVADAAAAGLRCCVVIDDGSELQAMHGSVEVLRFALAAQQLCCRPPASADGTRLPPAVLLSVHRDVEAVGDEDDGAAPLATALQPLCDVVADVAPLSTGFHPDIEGKLTLQARAASRMAAVPAPVELLYKCSEKSVDAWRVGEEVR